MKKQILFLVILVLFMSLCFYLYSTREGFSAPAGSLSPAGNSSPGDPINVVAGSGDATANLNKIVNAITSAFIASPAPQLVVPPDYQILANDPMKKTVFSQDKCAPPQNPVTELPIDTQMKEMIDKHKVTMNDSLDKYIAKLDNIISALEHPENLLSINTHLKSTVHTGLPLATITYDTNMNSLVNLTLTKGDPGETGDQGSVGLSGISAEGKVGNKGGLGQNPFQTVSVPELPKWYKYQG